MGSTSSGSMHSAATPMTVASPTLPPVVETVHPLTAMLKRAVDAEIFSYLVYVY